MEIGSALPISTAGELLLQLQHFPLQGNFLLELFFGAPVFFLSSMNFQAQHFCLCLTLQIVQKTKNKFCSPR